MAFSKFKDQISILVNFIRRNFLAIGISLKKKISNYALSIRFYIKFRVWKIQIQILECNEKQAEQL